MFFAFIARKPLVEVDMHIQSPSVGKLRMSFPGCVHGQSGQSLRCVKPESGTCLGCVFGVTLYFDCFKEKNKQLPFGSRKK